MVSPSNKLAIWCSPRLSRATQAGWLLFALFALSLALPGISSYIQLLETVCDDRECATGQLTAEDALTVVASGRTLGERAQLEIIIFLFMDALLFVMAAFLIWRKPGDWVAVLGAFVILALATGSLAEAMSRSVPELRFSAQLIQLVQVTGLLPFFCLIPDGRFQPRWMGRVALAYVLAGALFILNPNVGAAKWIAFGLLTVLVIVINLLYRYRSLPSLPEQEQIVWALAGIALAVGAQLIGTPLRFLPLPAVPIHIFPPPVIGMVSVVGLLLGVGAFTCLAVALLSDELFQVDIVLNRALVYGILTLFVVGVYVLVVGYLSLVFQAGGNAWFSLVATGLAAVLFQPIRERVQLFVNRLLYGERDAPYQVLARLGQRLEAAFDPSNILPTIAQTVRDSLRLPYVAIALQQDGHTEVVAETGTSLTELVRFPLTYHGAIVGHLLVSPRQGDTSLSPADRSLLAALAQQASLAAHSVCLFNDLQQTTSDLQHSRGRLVLAREEERRRLRRDLHDDLAPMLAGLSLTAGTVVDLIITDPAKATQLAHELETSIRDAVGGIRRLVYDLRPPVLDEWGLLAAIRDRANQYSTGNLRVLVEAPEALPPLPAAVEVAAYRIVQEALMNVVRHARARTCLIQISLDAALHIEVADDGVGLPDTPPPGVGLRSMRERADELGGTCEIGRSANSGMQIRVELPVESDGGSR